MPITFPAVKASRVESPLGGWDPVRLVLEFPASSAWIAFEEAGKTGFLKVILSKPGRPRSVGKGSQNNLINGWCAVIAREFADGTTGQDIKQAMKLMAVSMGYPARIVAGQVIPLSESEVTVEQDGFLAKTIERFATEYLIDLPRSEEETNERLA